jgi:ATP-dependent DNA helicase RecG
MEESSTYDKKSLLTFATEPARWDWAKIAKHCVAFANARGGALIFGIEDNAGDAPPDQTIPPHLADRLRKGVSQRCVNVAVDTAIETTHSGGQVLRLRILPSRQSIAATTDGRYFIRIADESHPLAPDELPRLLADKDAYVWEIQTTRRVPADHVDRLKLARFMSEIRTSDRVSSFVKEKSDDEILEHYFMLRDGLLTNLGILWVGVREDRATLLHYPAIQFIKYDENEQKVAKRLWTDGSLNPKELITAVWNEVPDWRETTELPDGLFRKQVPHYDEVVIRELLANAIVHRPYTTRGDIFINLYPDRLEIHNPGLLPLGVTPRNILHQSIARNRHLAQVFYDLRLMEKEGSGYDRLYEVLLSQARPVPVVREDNDRVVVTISRRVIRTDIIDVIARADEAIQLRQRERITLGLVAAHGSLTGMELTGFLALDGEDRLRAWLGRLMDKDILLRTGGKTRAREYRVNPDLLRAASFRGPTTLKGIEPHRLRYLVLADLETYAPSADHAVGIAAIHQRIGAEIPRYKVKRVLDLLKQEGIIESFGTHRHTRYSITQKGGK